MLYVAIFILFLAVFTLAYGVLFLINEDKIKIEKRFDQIKDNDTSIKEETDEKSFFERMIKPVYQKFNNAVLKATPGKKIELLNKRLEKAGFSKNFTAGKWLFNKNGVVLIFSSAIGFLSLVVSSDYIKSFAVAGIMALAINNFFNFYLSRKIEDRKKKILKDLPYTLDLITVSVEAGLSFDGAVARVAGNINGELCDEFAKSLKEIRMGIERKDALRNMSERCGVDELSMLITSLIQADELGVSLSRVLRIESENLREHRKQIAREKAMKAPIKMLFPLILFIFPSIFIIILGPVAIKMLAIFAKR